jgi:hypothetical protein
MGTYRYFFYKIYKWASSNKNDYTPEHTALLFTSQSLFFNLFSIVNMLDPTFKFTTEQYFKLVATLAFLCLTLNYFIFLRGKKYLEMKIENSMIKNIVFLIYILGTYFLFFRSLYLLVPAGTESFN